MMMDTFEEFKHKANGLDNFERIHVSSDECHAAADALTRAFPWTDAAEGSDFWIYVQERLSHIAKSGE